MNNGKFGFYQDVELDLKRRSYELLGKAHEIISTFSARITSHRANSKIHLKLVLEYDEYGLPVVHWFDSKQNICLTDSYTSCTCVNLASTSPWFKSLLEETEKCLDILRAETEFLGSVCRKISFWKQMDEGVVVTANAMNEERNIF